MKKIKQGEDPVNAIFCREIVQGVSLEELKEIMAIQARDGDAWPESLQKQNPELFEGPVNAYIPAKERHVEGRRTFGLDG